MRKGTPPAEAFRTARLELMRELEDRISRQEVAVIAVADPADAPAATAGEARPLGSIEPPAPRVRLV
jgi:hypothetical protein